MQPDEQEEQAEPSAGTVSKKTNAAEIRRQRQAREVAADQTAASAAAATPGSNPQGAASSANKRNSGRPKNSPEIAPLPAGFSSKKDFILTFPASLSNAEVVGGALARGVEVTEHYVYKVRAGAKTKPATTDATKQPAAPSNAATRKPAGNQASPPRRWRR